MSACSSHFCLVSWKSLLYILPLLHSLSFSLTLYLSFSVSSRLQINAASTFTVISATVQRLPNVMGARGICSRHSNPHHIPAHTATHTHTNTHTHTHVHAHT